MNKTPYYEIHAFTTEQFGGNPAGVCPLATWLPDSTMQSIAASNNLSETVFFVRNEARYDLRYFTPNSEVDLCGHATLACAWLLFEKHWVDGNTIEFNTRSGPLSSKKSNGALHISLPVLPYEPIDLNQELRNGLSILPMATYQSTYDLLCVYENPAQIEAIEFGLSTFKNFPYRGIILTTQGTQTDIYSRCFFPGCDVFEDPVTGSAHAVLAPFWITRLNKQPIRAEQGLRRRGILTCEIVDKRVDISGSCALYLEGTIFY
jgi:PhzF family phenazine biosynthesis protein